MSTVSPLEEERDFLLRSLADLDQEREAGEISEADYHALRDDYTARAAAALRAIEQGTAPPPTPPTSKWSNRRRAAVAVGIIGFAALAGVLVASTAGEREPGGAATGSIRESSVDRLAQARALFSRGEVVEALEAYDDVLAVDPDNREALAYRGFLLVSAGREAEARLGGDNDDLVSTGLSMLDRAVEVDPDYIDARVFRAMARLYVLGDPRAALEDVRVALDNDPPPDMVPRIAALHEDIEAALE